MCIYICIDICTYAHTHIYIYIYEGYRRAQPQVLSGAGPGRWQSPRFGAAGHGGVDVSLGQNSLKGIVYG